VNQGRNSPVGCSEKPQSLELKDLQKAGEDEVEADGEATREEVAAGTGDPGGWG